jgi:hypothetical protein
MRIEHIQPPTVKAEMLIRRPVAEVFEAFVNPDVTTRFWFTRSSAKLLGNIEQILVKNGIDRIWTWTAGYEAPKFYIAQSYVIFAELENWYSSGDGQVGFRKKLMTNGAFDGQS